jgi:hypothetical protein
VNYLRYVTRLSGVAEIGATRVLDYSTSRDIVV